MIKPLPVNLYDVVKYWLWIKKPETNPWGKPVPAAIYTEGLLNSIEALVESLPDSEHLADFRTLAGRYDRHSLWVAENEQVATLSRNRPSARADNWRPYKIPMKFYG